MLYRALFRGQHQHASGEGATVGFTAGIVPCPLTLFVMTFAIARGVPLAGVAFAFAMMIGIALVWVLAPLMRPEPGTKGDAA